ncbi:MMPL family transporter [Nocardia terpenica]|uniref:RND transporter n=1 Tax=Nocardia terpenica TaxID=455432 RepID=A0A291RV40_9NOCA|nr:MMPL family transporter [Nocardia terpenica]ATL71205.1 RND transporter [Nocardia terpenica]
MFTRWGDLVYRLRYAVLGVMVAALLGLGAYGFGVEHHLSSSGWDDPNSQASRAAQMLDATYGRDHSGDVILLYTAPDGKTVDDPQFSSAVTNSLNGLLTKYPNQIGGIFASYWRVNSPTTTVSSLLATPDKKVAFAAVEIKGDNDTTTVNNFRTVSTEKVFDIPGVNVQVAGLQAVSGTLNDTISTDQKRMEMLAVPAVAVLLFFIFGGVVAAALPLIVGGLTVVGANGIVRTITNFTEVNSFVGAVVSMIGLGLAIDYGLFIVSRFREELAEGYDTRTAVRRTVMTAGRTVTFSAIMIIAASAGMLLFPQGFLKSVAYGTIATVLLAALASITILPAILSILGKRVDMLGLKWFRKTKTAEEVENGFWGRSTQWVMKHPLKVAIPLCIILLLLIIPVKNLKFGGISETYLPPNNSTRLAQQEFDKLFPTRRTNPIQLVIVTNNTSEIGSIVKEAGKAPGLVQPFSTPGAPPSGSNVWKTQTTLKDPDNADATIDYLRSMNVPDDVQVLVGGQAAVQKDSVDALLDRFPLMIAIVLFVTTFLMFLTFGSLVLPIKAALMSALGLGSTLGILTWIFVDGHGARLLNFTPQPIMSPVLILIIAVIYGLSTDYEVFLMSRMVEARAQGASTTEAVRIGTAQTGRIITAAALILLVVVGAFAFSDLVMMQYIAYGMMAALFIDATVLRMLLVPATMKLLGDDCWWAPRWMKKMQQKIGLGEITLADERPGSDGLVDLVKTTPVTDPVTMQIPMLPDGTPAKPARKPKRARFIRHVDPEAPTEQLTATPATEERAADPAPEPPAPQPPAGRGKSRVLPPGVPLPQSGTDSKPAGPQGYSSGTENGSAEPGSSAPNPGSTEFGPTSQGSSEPQARSSSISLGSDAPQAYSAPTEPGSDLPGPGANPPLAYSITTDTGSRAPHSFTIPTVSGSAAPQAHSVDLEAGVIAAQPDPVAGEPDEPTIDRPTLTPTISTPQVSRPSVPPRTVPQEDSQKPADTTDSAAPTAPVGTTPRVLPPKPAKVPPHPATRAQRYQPHDEPASEQSVAPAPAPPAPPAPAPAPAPEQPNPAEAQDTSRSSIEKWMADLRSSRRRPDQQPQPPQQPDDEGKHRSTGRTVSVNELLRRQNRE